MPPRLHHIIDLGVFAAANITNLLLVVMFAARGRKNERIEKVTGLIVVVLGLPLAAAAVLNAIGRRSAWTWGLPLLMVLFCAVEYIVDYARKVEFRTTRAMKPYLILFYLALMAMVGYSFLLGRTFGYVTLATYFLQMGATAYSFGRVKHGA